MADDFFDVQWKRRQMIGLSVILEECTVSIRRFTTSTATRLQGRKTMRSRTLGNFQASIRSCRVAAKWVSPPEGNPDSPSVFRSVIRAISWENN